MKSEQELVNLKQAGKSWVRGMAGYTETYMCKKPRDGKYIMSFEQELCKAQYD